MWDADEKTVGHWSKKHGTQAKTGRRVNNGKRVKNGTRRGGGTRPLDGQIRTCYLP